MFLLEVMPFTGARRYQTSPDPANAYYLQCFLDETYYVDIVVATNQGGSGQVGSLSTKYPVHRPPKLAPERTNRTFPVRLIDRCPQTRSNGAIEDHFDKIHAGGSS